jgi:formate-nitrite transporter family protein
MAETDLETRDRNPAVKQEDSQSPRKSGRRILEQEITEGLTEIQRPTAGLLMSGLSAGLDLGFSVLLMSVILTQTGSTFPKPVVEFLTAGAYTIGYIFVILGRSELFTEHTTLAVLPVLNGRASLGQLGRLWGLIYASNLVGSAIFALIIVVVGGGLGMVSPQALGQISEGLVRHPWWVIVLSGVLAGWLMGLLSWLVTASRDTIGQVIIILLVTGTIGFIHLHHSIAGTGEVLVGLFAGQGISLADFGHFLLWATLGNSIGGVVFVGALKYGQVIRSGNEPETVELD